MSTVLTHQGRPYYGWRSPAHGLGSWWEPFLSILGGPFSAYGAAAAAEEGVRLAQPAKITEPPPTVTPAAPQTYGPLTVPGAWTPEEMLAQTQRQQRIANTAYGSGSRMGLNVGESGSDTDRTDTALIAFLVVVAIAGTYFVVRK